MTPKHTNIDTRHDGVFYAPDWRHRLALAIEEAPETDHASAHARKDGLVKQAVRLLQGKPTRSTKTSFSRDQFNSVRRLGADGSYRGARRVRP